MDHRNLLSESEIRTLVDSYNARMEKTREAAQQRPAILTMPGHYVDAAAIRRMSVACRIALGEDAASLRGLLSEALDQYSTLFHLRNLWQEEERRGRGEKVDVSFFSAERMYAATIDAIILNRADTMHAFAALDPAAYSGWHPPKFGSYHACLKAYFTFTTADRNEGRRLAEAFLTDPAFASLPETLSTRLRPQMQAAVAIAGKDQGAFDAALRSLLAAHESQAKAGGGATSPGTLVCFEGLALIALARRDGLIATQESIYLPVGLIA
jgi:hypothetical protein